MNTPVNWVRERFQCSVGKVFEQLKAEVREDVRTREELHAKTPEHARYAFDFTSTETSFTVLLDGHKLHKSVEFTLEKNTIYARSNGADIWVATVGLDEEGHCILRINGKNCERWQARVLALEAILFPEAVPDFFADFGGHRMA